MDDLTHIGEIPVLARPDVLTTTDPVVIVIHGMSTTAETLRAGWPDDGDDGLARVYWRLPVLREGREAVAQRRQSDLFRNLFAPVVAQSRDELGRLVAAFAPRPVGLFGFSIGGLITLLGAADQRAVRAAVAIGAVPSLEYLVGFFPDYDWAAADVLAARREHNTDAHFERLASKATCILHGDADTTARWSLIAPTADRLAALDPERHAFERFEHVQHRLVSAEPDEERDLVRLRAAATSFLGRFLGAGVAGPAAGPGASGRSA